MPQFEFRVYFLRAVTSMLFLL